MPSSRSSRPVPPAWPVVALLLAGCAGHAAEVSPAEIPELQAKVAESPGNGDLILRLAAALYAADRCDTAITVARTGMAIKPADALGPLVVGQCQERSQELDGAVATYDGFLAQHPDVRGAAAIRARRMLAERSRATQTARAALARETELAGTPPNPSVVAVLPLQIVGDSSYQPLSRGLAQMLTSDLALLERFRLVERLQLAALLDEMHLGESQRTDPTTVARVGHLIQAGRLVQGLSRIDDQNTQLEATVVLADGQVTSPETVTGRFRDLLRMEKELVVSIAGQLGYQLSEAERRTILENGTQDLAAFLAYSRGLEAEDLGDFNAAAAYFGQAAQQDPNFQAARTSYQAAQAAPAAQTASAGAVTQVAQQTVEPPAVTPDQAVDAALKGGVADLAPTQSEQVSTTTEAQTTTAASTSTTSNPNSNAPPQTVTGTIRIIFRLP